MKVGRTAMALSLVLVSIVSDARPKTRAPASQASATLRSLYEEDENHRGNPSDDIRRQDAVRKLIDEGKLQSAQDYFYAAVVFQHSRYSADYLLAHVLAVTAVNKGMHDAMWLAAASLDRYLQSLQQPQIFGTQFGSFWRRGDDQEPYDRKIVPDNLRTVWCVDPQATQAKLLAKIRIGDESGTTQTCPWPVPD
jgi:hypothetical protein